MNAAARELSLIGHAKAREPVLAVARQMRAANGQPPHPALVPVLVLTSADRITPAFAKLVKRKAVRV